MTGFVESLERLKFDFDAEGLTIRRYDLDKMPMGHRMEDHLRFAVACRQSFASPLGRSR